MTQDQVLGHSPGSAADARWMRAALGLAKRARGRTAPNPCVGAVIVRGRNRVSGGYHVRAGALHGEASAIRNARGRTQGATLYVTLEPCAHHGRQPPCVDAVLEAGFARVVVGMRDPDPRTSGRALARMRRAGIEVVVGVEAEACHELVRGYVSRSERGRPFTTLKLAASLDGRIATASGESRWVTGPKARARVHALRASVDAIAVGSETVLADDPELTARSGRTLVHAPTRIVIDGRLRTPKTARVLRMPGQTWFVTKRGAPAGRKLVLEAAGGRLLEVAARGRHVDLRAAWRRLARDGVNDLLVEGGGVLGAALLRANLVDRLHWFQAPLLIGGDGRPVLDGLGVRRLASAVRPHHTVIERLGDDWLVTAELGGEN